MRDKMSDGIRKKIKKVLMNLKDLSDIGGQFSEKMNFFKEKTLLNFLSIRNAFLCPPHQYIIQVHYRS